MSAHQTAISSLPSSPIKRETDSDDSIAIKAEPFDGNFTGPDIDSMTPLEIAQSLANISGGKITLCYASEFEMRSSCCNMKLKSDDDRLLWTTWAGRSHRGPATRFNDRPPNRSAAQLRKLSTRFFHTDVPTCVKIAEQDPDDLILVYCRQKPSLIDFMVKPAFPKIDQPCDFCGASLLTDGKRDTIQIKDDRDDSIHVFGSIEHMRGWYKSSEHTPVETKAVSEGEVEIRRVNPAWQFQVASYTSVGQQMAETGTGRKSSMESLSLQVGRGRERVWT
jgi:hypothetical protein